MPPAAATEPQAPVFTDEHPEYPKLLYNHKDRTTKAAKDKEEQKKLEGEGYVEEPLPPEDPEELTSEEVKTLEALLAKAAKALAKLGKLSGEDKPAPPKKENDLPTHRK